MSKTIAYIRTSTDKQELDNQRLEILDYAWKKGVKVDTFIEISISTRKSDSERRIDELLERLADSGTVIVTELSRLGRSTSGIIDLVNVLVSRNIRVIVIKQNLDMRQHDMNSKIIITLFSLFAELERDLISIRTKEALAIRKSKGIILGKRKGTIQKSKFDAHIERIKELLKVGLSVRKIAKVLGYNNHISLNTYLKKRNVRGTFPKT